jgi:hypothetical protein
MKSWILISIIAFTLLAGLAIPPQAAAHAVIPSA